MGSEKRGEEVRQPEPIATSKRGHWGWSGWFQKQNETKRMIISDGLLGLDTTVRNASDISISLAFLEVFCSQPMNRLWQTRISLPHTHRVGCCDLSQWLKSLSSGAVLMQAGWLQWGCQKEKSGRRSNIWTFFFQHVWKACKVWVTAFHFLKCCWWFATYW